MALVDRESFDAHECARVYIAGRLREARSVEAALTAAGIDYTVEIERFERMLFGFIRREYDGVGFHVVVEDAQRAQGVLREAGLTAGLEDDGR